jgi:4-diphosphocytidyl-2-C-methyl-D-erythritol kinase
MELLAPAKVNLSLDILGKRPDGYHDLNMVMHSVTLADRLTLTHTEEPGVRVVSGLSFLPGGEKNLAVRAAREYAYATGIPVEGLRIRLDKHIPVCAGLAGGSSDAAAVLRGLNGEAEKPLSLSQLAELGAKVGSDVPYCVWGGTALVEGRGEKVTPLPPLPPCRFVLCKPPFPVSTPELFGKVQCGRIRCHPDTSGMVDALRAGDLEGVARRLYNVFEDVLDPQKRRVVEEIKGTLITLGALGAVMSGSGPTVFGMFRDKESAQCAAMRLKEEYRATFFCKNAGKPV